MTAHVVICFDTKQAGKWRHIIRSVEQHTKEKVHFHLLVDKGMAGGAIGDERTRIDVHHVSIPEIGSYHGRVAPGSVSSRAMFYRWLAPERIDAERFLYLDTDVIVQCNVAELMAIDLKGNIVAAVPDCYQPSIADTMSFQGEVDAREMLETYGCDLTQTSYMSGQYVCDTWQWRKHNITEELIEFVRGHKTNDMLAFNVILQGKILPLGSEYSVPCNGVDTDEKMREAKILHCNGMRKFWMSGYQPKRIRELYLSYLT